MNEKNLISAMTGANAIWGQNNPFNNSTMAKEDSSNKNNSIMFQNKSSSDNNDAAIIRPSNNSDISVTMPDWAYDAKNVREAPGEYKLGFLGQYLNDKFLKQFAENQTLSALIAGMQPEYAQIYGEFSAGMLFEFFGTISISGIKSTSGYYYDDLLGSGAGNLYRRGFWARDIKITDTISKLTNDEIKAMLTARSGHAYRDHIGKTFEQLKEIANDQKKLCSTFNDDGTAMKAVRESLSQNEWKINKWLNNDKEYRLELSCDHPESLGFGVKPNSETKVENVYKSRMWIYKDSKQKLGYRIDTIFPDASPPTI